MKILSSIIDLCRWMETDEGRPETEFLGDLYQLHCEAARKGRALVQTPDFVRRFILDQTLTKVIEQHGPCAVKLIDPSCGCGHFLVDAFRQTFDAWMALPGTELRRLLDATGGYDEDMLGAQVAQIVLDQVVGVDLDPVCVSLSRMRLTLEAWSASGFRMPFRVKVLQGDSLLHGRPRPGDEERFGPFDYDVQAVRAALAPGQYTAVVGNPPYIQGKDRALREAYRERYISASGNFALSAPFTELFFDLAVRGKDAPAEVKEEQGVLFAGLGAGA